MLLLRLWLKEKFRGQDFFRGGVLTGESSDRDMLDPPIQKGGYMRYRGSSFLSLFLCCFFLLMQIVVSPVFSAEVETQVSVETGVDPSRGYLIYFRSKPDFSSVASMTWKDRGNYVMNALQKAASKSQTSVRTFLDAKGVKYQAFWIDNVIAVEASSQDVLNSLSSFRAIASIKAMRVTNPSISQEAQVSISPTAVGGNISHVKADQVWAQKSITGKGVVVASIDTGVRYTHQALVGQYRGNLGDGSFDHNFNWYDPGNKCGGPPCDVHNHGTHVMGTMIGDDGSTNQIGMAPGAKWIACRGCNASWCTAADLLACAQFTLAPTDLSGYNPDPDKRPHIVNNSWSGTGGDDWFLGVVNNWQAAGLYPVFPVGNAWGNSCGSAMSPGDYPNVTAVGAIDHTDDQPAIYSGRGPAVFEDTINPLGYPTLKPQVSAPGVLIRSSIASGDGSYSDWDGTSVAAPHVSGLLALMLEACPTMAGRYSALETILMETATPIPYVTMCGREGGGTPNQATGWGVIDALAAVDAVLANCNPMGTISGTVMSGGSPVAGATVSTGYFTAMTSADGTYTILPVPAGTHNVTVTKYGYADNTATGVVVTANATTIQNFNLTATAPVMVRINVTDGSGAGWPLYASVAVSTAGFDQKVVTDPATGQYTIPLQPGRTYAFSVVANGYNTATSSVAINGAATVNIPMTVQGVCTAPGYEIVGNVENFDSATPPALPSGWATTRYGGWEIGIWATTSTSLHPLGVTPISAPNMIYFNSNDVYLWTSTLFYQTKGIDLSGVTTYGMQFWMYHDTTDAGSDVCWGVVSTDGGSTWHGATGPDSSRYTGSTGWARHSFDLSAYTGAGMNDVRIGLIARSGFGNDMYIDNVAYGACTPKAGGLMVGRVTDANTSGLLADVTISSASEQATTDSSGVFVLFSAAGTQPIEASGGSSGYGNVSANVAVSQGQAVLHDFALPAGQLTASSGAITVTLAPDQSATRQFRVGNTGGIAADMKLQEQFYPAALVAHASSTYTLPSGTVSNSLDVAQSTVAKSIKTEATGSVAVPVGRRFASAAVSCDGSSYYAFGGMRLDDEYYKDSWRYDPGSGVSTRVADMPYGLADTHAACIDNLIYLVGGSSNRSSLNYFLIYDTKSNSWASSTGPVAYGSVAAANGKLYVFSGNRELARTDIYMYNPVNGTWTEKNPLPFRQSEAAAVAVGSYIYLIGGYDDAGILKTVTRYDTATDTWSTAGPQLLMPRGNPLAVWYGDYIYVVGGTGKGYQGSLAQTKTEAYNPNLWPTGSWSIDEAMLSPAVDMTGACCSSRIWSFGGIVYDDVVTPYEIGGSRYLWKPFSECHIADIPWLSGNPPRNSIPAGTSQIVTVTLNTKGLTAGTYTAGLKIAGNTPYENPLIPVTLVVAENPKNLMVMKTGPGTGTVTSNPAGINCGTKCSSSFTANPVVLTAVAASGSTFVSWTGCTSVSGTTCTVSMTGNRTVTARFNRNQSRTLTVTRTGTGAGTVTSTPQGINCGTKCSSSFTANPVVLTAVAASGSTFVSWTGCTSVSGATCTVSMTGNRAVSAQFTK